MRTNVILAGKSDSHRHSTLSLSKNVVVAKTSYQMLEILSIDRERALPPSTEISELTFVMKKLQYDGFPGCYVLENKREIFKLNVVLVIESKAL